MGEIPARFSHPAAARLIATTGAFFGLPWDISPEVRQALYLRSHEEWLREEDGEDCDCFAAICLMGEHANVFVWLPRPRRFGLNRVIQSAGNPHSAESTAMQGVTGISI
jgi:hypothetical protein